MTDRRDDDWIVDDGKRDEKKKGKNARVRKPEQIAFADGTGYADDGREIFDDDEEQPIQAAKKGVRFEKKNYIYIYIFYSQRKGRIRRKRRM